MDIIPCYDSGPNETIHLASDIAVVRWDGEDCESPADVLLVFQPTSRLTIETKIQDKFYLTLPPVDALKLKERDIDVPGFVTGWAPMLDGSGSSMNLTWGPSPTPITGLGSDSTEMETIIFHIFNFLDVIGTPRSTEEIDNHPPGIQHINLESKEWKVDLRSLSSTKDVLSALNGQGGYGITHIGGVRKRDGSSFPGAAANEVLLCLHLFLSFAKGGRCEFLSVGFNSHGNRVWESWDAPSERWQSQLSWFDAHHAEQLVGLFPGFCDRLADDNWEEAIREAIYWYILSNRTPGIDGGIILSQAAIERLSFEYSVNDKRLIDKEGFVKLRASDRMRLIFSSLNIPLEIPDMLPVTQQLASKFGWVDAPHALTEVRNSFVHPVHRRRGQFKGATPEIWKLGLQYLEWVILRLCKYEGTYGNRLKVRWTGEVEDVPWN